MKLAKTLLAAAVLAGCALGAAAQESDATLADIRQQLSLLYGEVETLRSELTASGAATSGVAGSTPLERLAAIEAELQRLTAKTEQLEFRINRITVDGTNRIGDLEFRLCELEEGCDISLLGDTPSLGGVDSAAQVPLPSEQPVTGPALAVGEQADFDAAQTDLSNGNLQAAADRFGSFVSTYPGSPLSAEAYYLRGEALEGLGQLSAAARAYLDSFSGDPSGTVAPDALFKLGTSLAALGQVEDACVTLREVANRFPSSEAVPDANAAIEELGCG